ncbi:2-hydroxyacid dehydrogenase [Halovenus marina]|uniref:2-hydroxyacid dehydrogenase n=1 Tax=Halovenus marina TaxID=3396621 RepID=UPI003F56022C
MATTVALNGSFLSEVEPILDEHVTEPVEFVSIPDDASEDTIRSVMETVDVLVGEWPDFEGESSVRLVQQVGAGVDSYEREVLPASAYLCNVYGHATGVAEHVFTLLLALRRRLIPIDRDLREGQWPEPQITGTVQELGGLTMGVVGFGRIGRALVDMADAFGMNVVAMRSSEPTGSPPDGVEYVVGPDALDRLLDDADVAVLSLPLTEETEHLIGPSELDALGEDGYLINVARGPVVDEAALYDALSAGTIAGAGIDTWYNYPDDHDERCEPASHPFGELDNVVMTPHIAGWTEPTADHRWRFIAGNIDRIARGERPENVVWEPREQQS